MPIGRWLYEAVIYSSMPILIILVSKALYPRLWLKDYPEPIQKAAAAMSKREKIIKRLLDVPLMIIKVGYPVFSAFVYKAVMRQAYDLWFGFVHLILLFGVLIIINLVLVDGLIVCALTPRFVIIKVTEHLKSEYKNFTFYIKKALGDFGLSVLISALVTGMLVRLS